MSVYVFRVNIEYKFIIEIKLDAFVVRCNWCTSVIDLILITGIV